MVETKEMNRKEGAREKMSACGDQMFSWRDLDVDQSFWDPVV